MGFKSWESYHYFFREVTRKNRYIYSDDVQDFLSNVLETSKAREKFVASGSLFWRAQLGSYTPPRPTSETTPQFTNEELRALDPVPFSHERMKPVQFEAPEGRVNAKGLPCLYLATTKETAIAEVRPWLDSNISVGQFEVVKNLRLIDCSVHPSEVKIIYLEEPDDQTKEEMVWENIDEAFSEPVTPNDKTSDYVPTQIIAELFKHNGYDGVIYRSAQSDGLNVALFDIDAATMVKSFLYRVETITYSFEQQEPMDYDAFRKNISDQIEPQLKARGLEELPPI
ncbi:MAG: RES family NAD+ phosphorylase [Nitrospira sp. SB0678_bin_10]|nr:RES family NAD+ phosphorylase [Nitrospira sp. SB0678_bin_10]